MKYLILIALFFAVLWALRKSQAPRSVANPPVAREPESMVMCANCGVNQARSESIFSHGRYFCCVAHQREGEREASPRND
jgi:uncharacterized protein